MDLSFKGSCKNKNIGIITFLYREDFQVNIISIGSIGMCGMFTLPRNHARGTYESTWESLLQYGGVPEWFQDAKFGVWAHWGS